MTKNGKEINWYILHPEYTSDVMAIDATYHQVAALTETVHSRLMMRLEDLAGPGPTSFYQIWLASTITPADLRSYVEHAPLHLVHREHGIGVEIVDPDRHAENGRKNKDRFTFDMFVAETEWEIANDQT